MSDDGARAGDDDKRGWRKRPQQQPPATPVDEDMDYGRYDHDDDDRDDDRAYRSGWQSPGRSGGEPKVKLPSNIEAEAALIGACIIDNRILERERTVVEARHFFEATHGRIWQAMLDELDRGNLVTPITLRPILENDPGILELGGIGYLATLTGSGAGLIGARAFAKQLVELAARRELHAALLAADEIVLDTSEDAGIRSAVAGIDEAMSKATELDRRRAANMGMSVQQAWDETFDDMTEATDTNVAPGMRIDQYDDWNDVVGGMLPGDLLYLGGRPSMGKTGVSIKLAMGAATAFAREQAVTDVESDAVELPGAVEYFSLEMSRKPIMQRAIADAIYKPGETSNFDALINGRMTSRDKALIRQMRAQIEDLPLNISDPTEQMMVENFASEIRRRQRKWKKTGRKLKLVIADYLGRFGTLGRFNSQADRVTHISATLKSAAKECGVALVVLVQLSRALEGRDDKRPMLQDLRDSGSLEQDADIVVFVYRDQYYLERSEPPRSSESKWNAWDLEMAAARDRMELIGAKRRQGALVRRTGWFVTNHQAIRSSEWRYGDDLFGGFE